jgi:aryl-alcohol dehydrogenase
MAGRPAYCRRFHALNSSGRRGDGTTTMGPVHGSFLGQSSFATHALASVRNAVRVPADLPLERLGPLGCGVLTGAGAVLNVLRPAPGSELAVFGLGTVGLSGVMAGAVAGCERIIGIDPDAGRRALALELGATQVLAPSSGLARELRVAASLETVGSEEVVAAALSVLTSPGTCASVGFRGARNPITIDQGHLVFGRTLTGVIEGDADPQTFVPRLLELHRDGRFPFDRLITEFPFERLPDALAAARGGDVVKPVLRFA